jgi:hypothetical protein
LVALSKVQSYRSTAKRMVLKAVMDIRRSDPNVMSRADGAKAEPYRTKNYNPSILG